MKHTGKESQTPQHCKHEEKFPVAYFANGVTEEAWLVTECSDCNEQFAILGYRISSEED